MRIDKVPASKTARRRGAAAAALLLGVSALTACAESAGPEQGAATTDDLRQLEQEVGALEDRVGALEAGAGDDSAAVGGAGEGEDNELFTNSESFLGRK
jgi:hypothetical protein